MELRCHVRKVDFTLIDESESTHLEKGEKNPKKKKAKMHNVYTIDIYQRNKVIRTIVRRKSDFKRLAEALEKRSTAKGGRKLTKTEVAELPSMPWFFRPLALFKRELP